MNDEQIKSLIINSYKNMPLNINDVISLITLYAKDVLEMDTSKSNIDINNPFVRNDLNDAFITARQYYQAKVNLVAVFTKEGSLIHMY